MPGNFRQFEMGIESLQEQFNKVKREMDDEFSNNQYNQF